MAFHFLQFVCSALLACGLFFIGIELRVRYDRSNLYFGSSLLVLCGLAGIDLWVLPGASVESALLWTRIQHVLAILFSIFLNLYLIGLAGGKHTRFLNALFAGSIITSILIWTPWMLHLEDGVMVSNWGYALFFGCYVALVCGGVANSLFIQSKHAEKSERKILRMHTIGLALLLAGAVADFFIMSFAKGAFATSFPSFLAIGILGFGVCASSIFAERFFQLLREKESVYRKLETAYVDMEKTGRLRQLGESTAMINHEIKNYMFLISGNAQMLQEFEDLSPKGKSIVENIVGAVDRLTRFSKDILELSRTHVLQDARPIGLTDLVRRTCQIHFADRKEFLLLRLDPDVRIQGDPDKLEQMLVNLIQNAFEASRPGELPDLRITLRAIQNVVLLSLEDHGVGCSEENLTHLFKAFHTTKRGKGGNGLGMSLSRTIVESHGGKINAYSRNFSGEDEHGLIINMVFPQYTDASQPPTAEKSQLVLFPDAMEDLEGLLRILANVSVTPYVVSDMDELTRNAIPLAGKTLILSSRSKILHDIKPQLWRQVALINAHHHQLYITCEVLQGQTELLTEGVVLNLVTDKQPKVAAKPAAPKANETKGAPA